MTEPRRDALEAAQRAYEDSQRRYRPWNGRLLDVRVMVPNGRGGWAVLDAAAPTADGAGRPST